MANRFELIENIEPESKPRSIVTELNSKLKYNFFKVGQIFKENSKTGNLQPNYCRVINCTSSESSFYIEIKWLTGYRLFPVMTQVWDSKLSNFLTIEKVNDTDKFYSVDSFNAYNFEYVSEY